MQQENWEKSYYRWLGLYKNFLFKFSRDKNSVVLELKETEMDKNILSLGNQ